jgi:hypothetical protein
MFFLSLSTYLRKLMVGPRTCPHAEYQASDKQEQANDDEEDGDSSFLANKVDMVDIA